MYLFRVVPVLLLVLLFACSDGRRNIEDYYFPSGELAAGRVYAYAGVEGDTSDRRYWYYRTIPRDSGLFLVGTQYDRVFEVVQMLREKIVASGSLARESFLYETDPTTGVARQIPAVIEAPDLFPFQVRDSLGVFLFRMHYQPPGDSLATIYVIRNRRFLGDGPDFEFNGKTFPTIRFSVREAIGHDREGASEFEGEGEEWYARDLGLVFYRRSFSGGKFRYAYRLQETFAMQELERRAGQGNQIKK